MTTNAPTGAQLRNQGTSDALAAATTAVFDYAYAIECILDELCETGRTFTADDVQRRCQERHGDTFRPRPNVVPAAFSRYARQGRIRMVGVDISRRPGRHAGILRQWVGVDHSPVEAVAA